MKKKERPPLTDKEIQIAFERWSANYLSRHVDKELRPFLTEEISSSFSKESVGWLRSVRMGLQLPIEQVAKKMKVTRAAYWKFEDSEVKGTISLQTLRKAAKALDCELVYAIRPRNKKTLAQIVWDRLLTKAQRHPWLNGCDIKKRAAALKYAATEYLNDPQFRRDQGWSKRKS